VSFRIGSDFCIPRNYRGQLTVPCEIAEGPPRAFPDPDRGYSFNDELIYRLPEDENPLISITDDFFVQDPRRLVLAPNVFIPSVWRITDGTLTFDFTFANISIDPMSMGFETREELQALVYEVIQGDWTCFANNTFGQDSATTSIRRCGMLTSYAGCIKPYEIKASDYTV